MPQGKAPKSLTVDFSNVEDRREGGKSIHVDEGDYLLAVHGAEIRKKKDDETSKYISWKLSITKPDKWKNKPGFVYHVTTLKEEGLWSLRNFLEDLGVKIPKTTVKIPLAEIVSKKMVIGATLVDDEYNEKVKSVVAATFKKAEFEETASDDDDEEEEDGEEEAEETEETEEEEEEEEEEEVKPKKSKDKVKKKAKSDDDDDEDEDLEELNVDDL